MQVFFEILENATLLCFLGVVFTGERYYRARLPKQAAQALTGLGFGLVAVLVTANPLHLPDGATVDARAGPVLLAGVIGGPIGGFVAAVCGSAARGAIGGDFAFSGMVVYFGYAALGSFLARPFGMTVASLPQLRSIIVLVVISWVCAASMFFLITPADTAARWLHQNLPLILLANAFSIIMGALVVGIAKMLEESEDAARDLGNTLDLAKTAGGFGVWDYDIAQQALKWDQRAIAMHGFRPGAFSGDVKDWVDTVHPDDRTNVKQSFQNAISGSLPFSCEYRVRQRGEEDRVIKSDALIQQDATGKPVRAVGTVLELSALRNAEARLTEARAVAIQAQKFETIGKLTGGVAHDFNNLLAVIMGNLELLNDEVDAGFTNKDDARTLINGSLEATKRGADLSRNMLAYARQAQLSPVATDINEIVRETETWMRRTIASSIAIETVLQAGLWRASLDRASIQSAIINLLVNARDALEGKGQITIETSNVRVDQDYITERGEDIAAGRYVLLAVSDNGPGIAPDTIEKIFDPFFTTKPMGMGSGLGLSMVQGFVKQSGGTVRVYSEVGMGTSFKLYLPVDKDASPDTVPPQPLPTHNTAEPGAARILLVEDDQDVLSVLRRILVGAGYNVTVATSGDKAFEMLQTGSSFDLIVTDIVMPGRLQGPSLARAVREFDAKIRFIFLSGYASESTVHGNGLRVEDIRLMKPVSRARLVEAVETALKG